VPVMIHSGDTYGAQGRLKYAHPLEVHEAAVDHPRGIPGCVDRGALALDLPYCQPPLRRTDRAIPLVLYYQALGAPRAALPVAEVRRLIYTIWRRAYRIRRPLEYAGFRAMLRALSGRIRVGRLPLRPTQPSK